MELIGLIHALTKETIVEFDAGLWSIRHGDGVGHSIDKSSALDIMKNHAPYSCACIESEPRWSCIRYHLEGSTSVIYLTIQDDELGKALEDMSSYETRPAIIESLSKRILNPDWNMMLRTISHS